MGYKKTLLQLVQEILSSTDGSEINSYTDNTESLQVSRILENTYWDIVSTSSFGTRFNFFTLNASGNTLFPTVMTLPSNVVTMESLKYNNRTATSAQVLFRDVTYLVKEEFLGMMYEKDSTDVTNVTFNYPVANSGSLFMIARKDTHPSFYTTFDDQTVLFDSYDSGVDTTLQSSKTLCYGETNPVWTYADSFVPDLPEKQFTILRNEAKATAFVELKQQTNSDAVAKARKGWISSQKTGDKITVKDHLLKTPNYGKRT